MNERTWLAVALCCAVWFVYMTWFGPKPEIEDLQSPPSVAETTSPSGTSTEPTPTPTPTPTATSATTLTAGSGSQSPDWPIVNHFGRETEHMEVPSARYGLTRQGGHLTSVALRDYREGLGTDARFIHTVDPSRQATQVGVYFTHRDLKSFNDGEYQQSLSGNTLVFERSAAGTRVVKTIHLPEKGHFADFKVHVYPSPTMEGDLGFAVVPLGNQDSKSVADAPLEAWGIAYSQNESVTRKTLTELDHGFSLKQGTTQWISLGNRYFSTVYIPEGGFNPDVALLNQPGFSGVYARYPLQLKKGGTVQISGRFFSGPKEYDELKQVPSLSALIDYGMFSILAFPMLEVLRFFYRYVGNYGLAIILLTILVRVIFYPLSLKSFQSMKAMQKLQPQLNALKEKYKDDAQKFGQEQLALFRAHKVNPAGGCLPMLVQLPVFIALYALLSNSIELFHAPFFGWIQDLSSKDPFYVFPVLMGTSMFVQQKMTPAPGLDPTQQKVMLLMPVIFSFVMLSLPSGLTIYIFLSTLLGILQQWLMTREDKAKAVEIPVRTSETGAPEKR